MVELEKNGALLLVIVRVRYGSLAPIAKYASNFILSSYAAYFVNYDHIKMLK